MTCANKALPGGCPLHNIQCGYPECDKPKDMVNHPQHYGSHPSGVECIELVRLLPFSIGNAIKYVMRRDDKGTAKQDLQKAIWYINDELEHLYETPVVAEVALTITLARRIELSEPNEKAKAFYHALVDYLTYQMYSCPITLHILAMRATVEELLNSYQ